MAPASRAAVKASDVRALLEADDKVKVGGVDVDGIIRGKIMAKDKFLAILESGFGFCSVIFGWDMHDASYVRELAVSNKANGYRDVLAIPDPSTYRRIPWEDNIPFFLVDFYDPDTKEPLHACPRALLAAQVRKMQAQNIGAFAGAEYEFYQFKTPDGSHASPTNFLSHNAPHKLPHLTEGMTGYSITQPLHNKDYFYGVFDACNQFRCNIEGWHCESGPAVFEAALAYGDISEMADRASLFKLVVKSTAISHGITPCFMAKPRQGLPGNSGHMHISLVDNRKKNLLVRESADPDAPWPDLAHISDLGRHFLAGIIDGLPDVMPMLAPTINSYKRLVENFWAPVTVSWGVDNRSASVRLVAPPFCEPAATRFEVRVAGADANPYFVLAAIAGLGWRGVEKELDIAIPPGFDDSPASGGEAKKSGERLARTLREATGRFMAKDSVAREVFGDAFVDHFGGTREHEIRQFDEAVTDWEMRRYIVNV